ncbi:MAG: glutamine-hydrolyzing carbamoyl-phosphate synthase small subunit [Actinomycetota bacterium]|nr:glutamine-hydrolyzing carbamoyl-phosphate synthase small subunit [Actinomycetota bacterium]
MTARATGSQEERSFRVSAPEGAGRGFLVLEDGTVFSGRAVGAPGRAFGEAVFTTAMTGYQEVVTDPSYAEQIVCFTAPMVGNYGVAPARSESERVHARAVVMRCASGRAWSRWLAARGIVALDEVDTRSLVLHLRERGAMRAAAVAGEASVAEVLRRVRAEPPMTGRALVAGVSTERVYSLGHGPVRIAVVDYGSKRSLLGRLCSAGARVTVYPHDVEAADVLASRPDAVVLSNGPGDPAALDDEVRVVSELVGRVPLLGICLGHQLLARAAGLGTRKLPFGHRGANHPVLECATGRVLVTAQNHGFAVAGESREVTHVSLYDGTVEGLRLHGLHAASVQFHPEAAPGPHDALPLLEGWVAQLRHAAAA